MSGSVNSARRGSSLAEVLLAAGILTTVLLLLVGVFIGGLNLMERSEVYTTASNVAREVFETLQDEGGFAALPLEPSEFDGSRPDPRVDRFPPEPYPVATRNGREFTISLETLHPSSRMTAVLVTVAWESGQLQLEKVFHAADAAI